MRFAEGYRDMPNEGSHLYRQQFKKSSIDPNSQIDLELLKDEVLERGPLQIWQHGDGVKFILNISPCQIANCDCGNDVISLTQLSGFTSLCTSIDKDELLRNESLNAFIKDFFHNPFAYYSSSGERQHIEAEIERHLGIVPMEVYRGEVKPEDLNYNLNTELSDDIWAVHNLQSIFRSLLLQRLEIGHFSRDDYVEEIARRFDSPRDFLGFLEFVYDLGFLTSRLIGEHFIREEIEPLAEKGLAAKEAQARRNEASGKSASESRTKRILEMLEHIEVLMDANPALGRLGLPKIAELAIEDAALANPTLWSQGKGRRDDYLDEIRSDIRYRERYRKIASKTV